MSLTQLIISAHVLIVGFGLHVIEKPSPNFYARLLGPPNMIILSEMSANCSETLAMYLDPSANRSSHYFICNNGSTFRLANESVATMSPNLSEFSTWRGRNGLSNFAITISMEEGQTDINELVELIKLIQAKFVIPDVNIVSEFDVNCGKTLNNTYICPTSFPPRLSWTKLSEKGIGFMPRSTTARRPSTPSVAVAARRLKTIGYYIGSQNSQSPSEYYIQAMHRFVSRFLPHRSYLHPILDSETFGAILDVSDQYSGQLNNFWKCFSKPDHGNESKPLEINKNFPSKNKDERLLGPPFAIVIHDTEVDLEGSLDILTGKRGIEVSIHYLIALNGTIYQLVDESMRAWHAGLSYWRGYQGLNDVSIGIELVNLGSANHTYPVEQIDALIELINDIKRRYWIPEAMILSHEEIAPLRREDPGRYFPWQILADANIILKPADGNDTDDEDLQTGDFDIKTLLTTIGYFFPGSRHDHYSEYFNANIRHFGWRYNSVESSEKQNASNARPIVNYERVKIMAQIYKKAYRENFDFRCSDAWDVPSQATHHSRLSIIEYALSLALLLVFY